MHLDSSMSLWGFKFLVMTNNHELSFQYNNVVHRSKAALRVVCVKTQGVVAVLEHNSKLEGAVLPPFYC